MATHLQGLGWPLDHCTLYTDSLVPCATMLQPCCVDLQDQYEPFCLPHGLQSHCRPPPLITLSPQELCWEGRELGHEEDREELNAAEVGKY